MNLTEDLFQLMKELERNRQQWQASVVKECYRVMQEQAELIQKLTNKE
jgi:hypothetical protein